ncbi:MAG: C4-type zinc ribbon domain-containing protein [Planctomycetota bacterium]
MGSTLEALLELRDIELQIVDIRRQLTRKERLVKRQRARLRDAGEKLGVEQDNLRRTQMDVDEIDLDLKGRTAHVNRMREHLNTVRTNKEYAVVLSQLNTEKADASRLESRALQLMESVEAQKKVVAELAEEERLEAAKLGDLQAQAQQAEDTFSGKLGELQQRRAETTNRLPDKAVTLFDRLSERYEGEAMAQIERTHPRRDEFICSGCHMSLSAESANAAMVRDDLITCRNCGRILYIEKGT